MKTQLAHPTAGAIWSRLLWAQDSTLPLGVARSLLRLQFAPEDKKRVHELSIKAQEGLLNAAEQEEIDEYEQIGNLLALMKSKARRRLRARVK